jgi:hypothetical protein
MKLSIFIQTYDLCQPFLYNEIIFEEKFFKEKAVFSEVFNKLLIIMDYRSRASKKKKKAEKRLPNYTKLIYI